MHGEILRINQTTQHTKDQHHEHEVTAGGVSGDQHARPNYSPRKRTRFSIAGGPNYVPVANSDIDTKGRPRVAKAGPTQRGRPGPFMEAGFRRTWYRLFNFLLCLHTGLHWEKKC